MFDNLTLCQMKRQNSPHSTPTIVTTLFKQTKHTSSVSVRTLPVSASSSALATDSSPLAYAELEAGCAHDHCGWWE